MVPWKARVQKFGHFGRHYLLLGAVLIDNATNVHEHATS